MVIIPHPLGKIYSATNIMECLNRSNCFKKCLWGLGINLENGTYEILFEEPVTDDPGFPFYYEFMFCPYCGRQLKTESKYIPYGGDFEGYPV
jgi:hypothetical protein